MSRDKKLHSVLRGLSYVVVAFLAIYAIGANVILNTGVLDSVISSKPEKTLIEWESGWTILPGFIHIEGLRVRGQSLKQQWQFTLGEADVRMNVFALPNKTVRASRVRGKDFSFRQRPRLTEDTPGESVAEFYPEIPGLSNPPVPAPEDIYPPKTRKKRGWNIRVAGIELDGSIEVAVNQLRLAGAGGAGGDFNYQLGGQMHLPTAYLDLDGSEIVISGETFVNQVYLRTDNSLGPFVPKETKGLEIFNHLLGSVSLENGTVPDIDVLNALMVPGSAIQFIDGTASFNWSFDKESVETGSHGKLAIAAEGADLLMGGRAVSADLGVNAILERGSLSEGSWALGETTLALDKVDVRLLKSEEDALAAAASPPTEDDLWWTRFTIRSGLIDLGKPSDLEVDFRFRMKNTDPLLHLFFAKPTAEGGAKLPLWVKAAPDVKDVEGSGKISTGGDGTYVEDVVIDGDDFDLIAILDGRGPSINGGLFVRYKGNSLGVQIEDGKKDLKILRPKMWFLEQEMFRTQWPIVEALVPEAKLEKRNEKAARAEEKKSKKDKKREKKRKESGDG